MKLTPVTVQGQPIPNIVTWEKLSPTVFRLTFTYSGFAAPETIRVDPFSFNPAAHQEPEYAPLVAAKAATLFPPIFGPATPPG